MERLADRVFVVTGAARGIGRAVASRLASEGARVGALDLADSPGLERTVADIEGRGGTAVALPADVTRRTEVDDAVGRVVDRWGKLDGIVNNAGINGVAAAIDEYPEDVFDRVIEVNLKGVWLGMRAAFPHLRRNGGGAIVNIASTAGYVGFAGLPAYTASKHAVIGLTKSAAVEGAADGIRVTAVCPAGVDTPLLRKSQHDLAPDDPERARQLQLASKPLGRFASADEVAGLCAYLLSDEASYVTGAPILMDGGQIARP